MLMRHLAVIAVHGTARTDHSVMLLHIPIPAIEVLSFPRPVPSPAQMAKKKKAAAPKKAKKAAPKKQKNLPHAPRGARHGGVS